jgi:glycosyltransferase involved in cell wall biosynthesis
MVPVKVVLSIIIPTHNRPRILQKCLDAIAQQTLLSASSTRSLRERSAQHDTLEVIVVSDGPDEKTAEMMEGLEWPFSIQYFAIPKSQQGVCRNRAVEKARGKYVLLIGDDIVLAPDACEAHLRAHEKILRHAEEADTCFETPLEAPQYDVPAVSKRGCAVLGFTTWDPLLKTSPLMKWMEKSGVQFGYPKIQKYAHSFLPPSIQHWFTYTSNLSLPAKLLWKNKFREDVSLYGWEDMEWGKRLAEAGMPLFYEPDARAFHHHQYEDAEVWERSRMLGESSVKMEKLVSGMRLTPRGWKKIAYRIISFLPTHRGRHCRAFLEGMKVSGFLVFWFSGFSV